MDFGLELRLTITKAIIELIDPSGSSSFVESRLKRNNRFQDGGVVVYKNDQGTAPCHHNCPLYVAGNVKDVELKRVMLDHGSSMVQRVC